MLSSSSVRKRKTPPAEGDKGGGRLKGWIFPAKERDKQAPPVEAKARVQTPSRTDRDRQQTGSPRRTKDKDQQ